MESFWRRLKYYGIGFGIGLILTFGFFNTRGCSWTPSNRVKETMNARIWVMETASQKQFYKANHFTDKSFYQAVQDASVAFTESKRHGNHKIYQLTIENEQGKSIPLLARMTDESALVEFIATQKNWKSFVKSKQTATIGTLLYTPNQNNLFYIPENRSIQEACASIGIQNDQQLNLTLQRAQFSFEKSRLKATPKPIIAFQLAVASNGREFLKSRRATIFCIWYKDKLKVIDLK
ncbi:MAG: hypothetical protein ACKOWW_08695 [Flavobacteriales bacterium]